MLINQKIRFGIRKSLGFFRNLASLIFCQRERKEVTVMKIKRRWLVSLVAIILLLGSGGLWWWQRGSLHLLSNQQIIKNINPTWLRRTRRPSLPSNWLRSSNKRPIVWITPIPRSTRIGPHPWRRWWFSDWSGGQGQLYGGGQERQDLNH